MNQPTLALVFISATISSACAAETESEFGSRTHSVQDVDAGPIPEPPAPPTPNSEPPYKQAALNQNELAALIGDPGYQVTVPGLTPRVPHIKPSGPVFCAGLEAAPNSVWLKFVDGADIRLGPTGLSSAAVGFPSAHQVEIDTINGLSDIDIEVLYDETSVSELLLEKQQAEGLSGVEQPDLTQWFLLYVVTGESGLLSDVHSDTAICDRTAQLLNDLNSMSVVELAEQTALGEGGRPYFSLPAPTDLTPTTPDMGGGSPWLGSGTCGVNKPESPSELEPNLLLGYQGENAGIAIVEGGDAVHESFNSSNVGGTRCLYGTGNGANHSMGVQSTAFGAGRSGWDSSNPLYGTRGAAPRVAGALRRACRGLGWNSSGGQGIRAGFHSPGDVVNLSRQHNGRRSFITKASIRDASQSVTSRGGFVNLCNGNRPGWVLNGLNNGIIAFDGKVRNDRSGAFVIAQGTTLACTPASSSGSRVDFTTRSVIAAQKDTGSAPTTNPDDQRYGNFAGCSAASPVISGVLAGFVGAYYMSHGVGHSRVLRRHPATLAWRDFVTPMLNRDEVRAALRESARSLPAGLGALPDALRSVLDFATGTQFLPRPEYSTAGPRRLWRAVPPHGIDHVLMLGADSVASTTTGITYEAAAGSDPPRWTAIAANPQGTWIRETRNGTNFTGAMDYVRSVPPGVNDPTGMSVEAWVRIQTSTENWQTILAKENPRNYGLWVGPTGHPAEGKPHFSFHPQGSAHFCAADGTTRIDDGSWHHVVAVQDWPAPGAPPRTTFYVDGVPDVPVATCAATGAPRFAGGDTATIGRGLSMGSSIAYAAIYRRRLEAAEVAARYASGLSNRP